ncbi:MFS transporter, partial [Mycolicibacterium mucogenicum]
MPEPRTTDRWRVFAPLRFRDYRLLIAAVSLSMFAEGMWTVVAALQVIALDNDPAALSLVATCLGTGMVCFVLVGGIAADRLNRRNIIITVEAINLVVVTAVAVLSSTGTLRLWHMAVAAACLGIAVAFFFPAYSALVPRLLPAEQLLAANGIEGVVRPVLQQAVGPATAGVLVGLTFPSVGATTVAVLFGVGLVLLVATRPSAVASDDEPVEHKHVLHDLRDGFRFMTRTPWLLWTLLVASVYVLVVLGPIEVLVPFIAEHRFDNGPRAYGFIMAGFGLGSAVGA